MIPKKIHYCWFGHGRKNDRIESCMESWSEYLSEFQIIEWNEDNIDIDICPFVREAYDKKMWAFVSDYVRLYVLYTEGGIYLDTDVEVTNQLDRFLDASAFFAFESAGTVGGAVMGAEKGNPVIYELLDHYTEKHFNKTPNPQIISAILRKYGLSYKNELQILKGGSIVYPKEYFFYKTDYEKNYAIHHFNASWITKKELVESKMKVDANYNITVKWLEKVIKGEKIFISPDFHMDRKIAIYGAGVLGKLLLEQAKRENVPIECFVERSARNESLNHVRMIDVEDLRDQSLDTIIITPVYDLQKIKHAILNEIDVNIVSIDELLK